MVMYTFILINRTFETNFCGFFLARSSLHSDFKLKGSLRSWQEIPHVHLIHLSGIRFNYWLLCLPRSHRDCGNNQSHSSNISEKRQRKHFCFLIVVKHRKPFLAMVISSKRVKRSNKIWLIWFWFVHIVSPAECGTIRIFMCAFHFA